MASNCVIFGASFLYSLILVLNFSWCELFYIFDLIRSISHLVATNEETLKDYSYSVIYSNLMKGAFMYSIATVFLSTTMTFYSFLSLRDLTTAITRHWKPFVASLVAAVIFPAMIRPPSMPTPFGNYITLTLIHALFVVYFSFKLVTMPMLEEKLGKDIEVLKKYLWRFSFWQISVAILTIGTLYLSKEAYKMQVFFRMVREVMNMILLASFGELMVFTAFIYEKKKKVAEDFEELENKKTAETVVLIN